MQILIDFFNIFLYQPLLNALILLYEYLPGHDFGIAVIVLTVAIRILFYPLTAQSIRSQKKMSELQPKLQQIQKQHKDNKENQTKAMMELYRKEKFNPLSGCLPLLIQLPVLIALYQVFWKGFQPEQLSYLYSFVSFPGEINPVFLGIINLSNPNIILAVAAGIAQFFQSKTMVPKKPETKKIKDGGPQISQIMQKQMIYIFPVITFFILCNLPSALGLYWIATAAISVIQQRSIMGRQDNIKK